MRFGAPPDKRGVERIDGGKQVRATCGTWDDAVVVLPDRVLTLSNHERQVRIGRGHRGRQASADTPRSHEDVFEGPDDGGVE
jgi:hypothetical protein